MKLQGLISSSLAFVAQNNRISKFTLYESTDRIENLSTPTEIPIPVAKPTPKSALPAKWLPIGGFKAPLTLDGTLAADVGFDPLGFAKSKKTLYWMREAEVKHGRLAMLAAVGW
jgi:hypothetical protein